MNGQKPQHTYVLNREMPAYLGQKGTTKAQKPPIFVPLARDTATALLNSHPPSAEKLSNCSAYILEQPYEADKKRITLVPLFVSTVPKVLPSR